MTTNFFWFRRDLRLEDNAGLYHALNDGKHVQCVFIFDSDILEKLSHPADRRVTFIHQQLEKLNSQLAKHGSTLLVINGKPIEVWKNLLQSNPINAVYTNHDYEPYALKRDEEIKQLLNSKSIAFHTFKDQVIFEKSDVVKEDNSPYKVFTPYLNKWKSMVTESSFKPFLIHEHFNRFLKSPSSPILTLKQIGFEKTMDEFPPIELEIEMLKHYHKLRDIPSLSGTSKLSLHLRFGTVSIRSLFGRAINVSEKWINELIWREFYMMILWHFPNVVKEAFKPQYRQLQWLNNEEHFQRWMAGQTGYPIVDAGMRELNATGWMHNRVRMITAMFLTKYLLIDWQWGETYFAEQLNDYELASNNGGWQWSAGTGVDAAPYFRIFSMDEQAKRFDPERKYILKWVPEVDSPSYPKPIVDYKMARERCLAFYKSQI